ncbi:hypothetical protein GCM10009665_06290 [Kitasatospora nipponensis]|uniref:UTRA domain-containing protein n=1 Tax=Kitasatospora nipponensis TaxID=258049 RepID=A0ABP4GI71_9ACTN
MEKGADLVLRAILTGEAIVVEGVTVPPGSDTAFLYRRTYTPNGLTLYCLVRLDALPDYGFPPPDPP